MAGARRLSTMVVAMTDGMQWLKLCMDKKWVRTNCLVEDGEATKADGAFDRTPYLIWREKFDVWRVDDLDVLKVSSPVQPAHKAVTTQRSKKPGYIQMRKDSSCGKWTDQCQEWPGRFGAREMCEWFVRYLMVHAYGIPIVTSPE